MAKKKSNQELKQYRHNVAVLKKKGLISKKYDARKVEPSSYLSKIINQNAAVLKGEAKTFKVSKKEAEKLKAVGFKVVRPEKGQRRVVVKREEYVRKGKVFEKPIGFRRGNQIIDIPLGIKFEQQVIDAFYTKQPGDAIGFALDFKNAAGEIRRGNSYSLYETAEALINDLKGYKSYQEGLISRLTVFRIRPTDQRAYFADGRERRAARFGHRGPRRP